MQKGFFSEVTKNKCPFLFNHVSMRDLGGGLATLMMEDLLNFLQPNLSKVVSTQLSGQNTHVLGFRGDLATFPVVGDGRDGDAALGVGPGQRTQRC